MSLGLDPHWPRVRSLALVPPLLLLLALAACGGGAEHRGAPAPTDEATSAEDPLTRLAAFSLPTRGWRWESRCELRLGPPTAPAPGSNTEALPPDPTVLSRHLVYAEDTEGRFTLRVEERADDDQVQDARDRLEAAWDGHILAVRRQEEPWARVPHIHGELALYRDLARGLAPALLTAFAPLARREGEALVLAPRPRSLRAPAPAGLDAPEAQAPATTEQTTAPSAPGDARARDLARFARLARLQDLSGRLDWPASSSHPRPGSHVSLRATLAGRPFQARCTFGFTPLRPGTSLALPDAQELHDLRRPRLYHDLQRVLEATRRAPKPGP